MMKLRYFSPETDPLLYACPCGECDVRPSKRLLVFLDHTRHTAGVPMIVTSGPRCKKYNKKIGGSEYSEHPDGDGADIEIVSSRARFKIVHAALLNGCRRLGEGKNFVHLGVSKTNDQDVKWTY